LLGSLFIIAVYSLKVAIAILNNERGQLLSQ